MAFVIIIATMKHADMIIWNVAVVIKNWLVLFYVFLRPHVNPIPLNTNQFIRKSTNKL